MNTQRTEMHDSRMGWTGLAAFVADEHEGRALVVTKPALRFTAEQMAERKLLDVHQARTGGNATALSGQSQATAVRFKVGDRVTLSYWTVRGEVIVTRIVENYPYGSPGSFVTRVEWRFPEDDGFMHWDKDTVIELIPSEQHTDGWVEWAGGKCPTPAGKRLQVRYRNGQTSAEFMSDGGGSAWEWVEVGGRFNIVAYKLVQP